MALAFLFMARIDFIPVSYTHLDVYKRQTQYKEKVYSKEAIRKNTFFEKPVNRIEFNISFICFQAVKQEYGEETKKTEPI